MLMELAFLLRGVGAEVVWITSQKPPESDEVIYSLENKMLDRGVQVPSLTSSSILLTVSEFISSFWYSIYHCKLPCAFRCDFASLLKMPPDIKNC